MQELERTSRRRAPRVAILGIGLVLALAAAGARAERLPLRGGRWIETRGPWRVAGDRVVFTTPEGNLRSLPVGEVAPDAERAPQPPDADPLPVSEYPWGGAVEIRDPPPPPPAPRARRAPAPAPPPRCRLLNSGPGAEPEWDCGAPAPHPEDGAVRTAGGDPA